MSGPHWVCPAHGVCVFLVYTAQILGCSARKLSKVGPGLRALPRSKPLRFRYSPKAQTRLGLRFVPFPGPSSSGRQLLGEFTVPGVPCVSRGELTSGCEPPDRCQPSRIPGRRG